MTQQQLMRLCRADEVPRGGVRQVIAPGGAGEFAVYRLGDEFFCTDDNCTHGMVFLSNGEVEGDQIFCPLHGGAFNIRTGKATEQPCRIALKTYKVVQVGDELFVDLT